MLFLCDSFGVVGVSDKAKWRWRGSNHTVIQLKRGREEPKRRTNKFYGFRITAEHIQIWNKKLSEEFWHPFTSVSILQLYAALLYLLLSFIPRSVIHLLTFLRTLIKTKVALCSSPMTKINLNCQFFFLQNNLSFMTFWGFILIFRLSHYIDFFLLLSLLYLAWLLKNEILNWLIKSQLQFWTLLLVNISVAFLYSMQKLKLTIILEILWLWAVVNLILNPFVWHWRALYFLERLRASPPGADILASVPP